MENNGDLSSMIQKIMQNPEFTNMVSELRGELGGEKRGDSRTESTSNKSGEDISAEMMSHLPEVMAMVSPLLGTLGKSDGNNSVNNSGDSHSKELSTQNPLPKKYDKAKAEKLLYAIKPYLSSTRCEIIDKCVSVMQLGDVMGALQGLEELTKSNKNPHGREGGT